METCKPKTLGSLNIEWNWDFDDQWVEMKSVKVGDQEHAFGKEGRFRQKGRCRRCWGGLIGKGGAESAPTAIRCRVCGILLEGDDAREEYQHMSTHNTLNMAVGLPPKYHPDATFVQKIFPYIERQSAHDVQQRIMEESSKGNKEGWLTRNKFPAGSAGFLFLQARALMSGVERLPRELSVVRFSDYDINDAGSATVYLSKDELSEHSKTHEYELMKRLGSTMTIAMMSAFACELAMKAIRLTLMDKARKSHDLWKLYCDLPSNSKVRIEEDFPEVKSVLENARHTFDEWRYFEANVGGHGISAMIDTDRAFALAKAARVLFDEAEMMGLGYSVNVEAIQKVTKSDGREHMHVKHNLGNQGYRSTPAVMH